MFRSKRTIPPISVKIYTVGKGPNLFGWKGKLIGYHKGIHLYTIGQEKGLNIRTRTFLYVIETRPDENCLVVGSKSACRKKLTATSIKSSVGYLSCGWKRSEYRQKEQSCSYSLKDNIMKVEFDEPIDAITLANRLFCISRMRLSVVALLRAVLFRQRQ